MSLTLRTLLLLTTIVLLILVAQPATSLKSDVGKKLAVVESETQSPHAMQQQDQDAEHEVHDHHEHDDDDVGETIVRCRFCGAAVALKKDYIGLHDTSKAVASKREHLLGDTGELHTFVNPSRIEMDLAGFKTSRGVESELYTTRASFFEQYNWRDVHCSACKRHVGWKFHHDDLQHCINTKTIDAFTAATAVTTPQSTTDDGVDSDAATSEKERRVQIVARAFAGVDDACVRATSGWWSYEVCYAKEVRQFHEEADGTRTSDWSMGTFVTPAAETLGVVGPDVVQYFAGGQHCDENGAQRSTKVIYTCCKTKPLAVAIDSVNEPTLCAYIITVCVPELCAKVDGDSVDLEGALELKKHAQTCEIELTAAGAAAAATKDGTTAATEQASESAQLLDVDDDKQRTAPLSFTALRWDTVISEDSSELDWARSMQFKV